MLYNLQFFKQERMPKLLRIKALVEEKIRKNQYLPNMVNNILEEYLKIVDMVVILESFYDLTLTINTRPGNGQLCANRVSCNKISGDFKQSLSIEIKCVSISNNNRFLLRR